MTRTILIYMYPEHSTYNASFTTARALANRGHRVVYIGSPQYKDHVKIQGFEYSVIGESAKIEFKGLHVNQFGRDKFLKNAIVLEIKKFNPDLVILDPVRTSVALPFIDHGIPIIHGISRLTAPFSLGYPPVNSNLIIEKYPRYIKELISLISWSKRLKESKKHRRLSEKQKNTDIEKIGQKIGIRVAEEGYHISVPSVMFSPADIDFPTNTKLPNRFYAGASVFLERNDGSLDIGDDHSDRPLIYCSMGTWSQTYPHAQKVFRTILETMRLRPEWRALIQISEAEVVEDLSSIPPNVVLRKFVPQLEALKRANVFITHGGFGSVREAIYFGVPMVVLPWANDGYGNAARIVYHKVGLRHCAPHRLTPKALCNLIDRAQDEEIKASVKRMQTAFESSSDGEEAAIWIEQFLPQTNNSRESQPPASTEEVARTGPVAA